MTDTSFPSVLADVPLGRLLVTYGTGPERLAYAVAGLTPEELTRRPDAGRWSVAEIVFHVVDAELVGAFRFRCAVAQPGFAVQGYDQDAWAAELRYRDRAASEVPGALDYIAAIRRDIDRMLGGVAEGGWDGLGVTHSQWGRLTLRQLLELYADHVERHLERVLEIREALGSPLEIPRLLPGRLYG